MGSCVGGAQTREASRRRMASDFPGTLEQDPKQVAEYEQYAALLAIYCTLRSLGCELPPWQQSRTWQCLFCIL